MCFELTGMDGSGVLPGFRNRANEMSWLMDVSERKMMILSERLLCHDRDTKEFTPFTVVFGPVFRG
jgi:hypothetical protein